MEKWVGKTAVITGASAGIGAAIAKELVQRGVIVVGLARRGERLNELSTQLSSAPAKFYGRVCDLSVEGDVVAAFAWTKTHLGGVDILVNNAGMARRSTLMEGRTEDWKVAFDTNVMALCVCTREAVKDMRSRGVAGHVIHINSVLGHQVLQGPNPFFNVYPATKFAVTALAETLRQELTAADSLIKVTSISPGRVETEFSTANDFVPPELRDAYDARICLRAQDVAEAVIYALGTAPHVQVAEVTLMPLGK